MPITEPLINIANRFLMQVGGYFVQDTLLDTEQLEANVNSIANGEKKRQAFHLQTKQIEENCLWPFLNGDRNNC